MVLVTCYPFDTMVPGGPLRYLVIAEKELGARFRWSGRLRIERGERFSFRANQGHVEVAFARTVEFDEEDGLPGAEDEFAIEDGDRERRTKNGGRHVRPCVRGIVTMPKVDLGNHLLNDIQQIFLRSLPTSPVVRHAVVWVTKRLQSPSVIKRSEINLLI